MDKNQVKIGYNQIANEYAKNRDQFKNLKYLEILNSYLNPHSTILDIGCGSGRPVDEYFIKHGHKIVGIDISDEQIKLAKSNFPGQKFLVRDMDNLAANEYQVDAVVSFYAIFHIPREKHEELFKKLRTYLPTGRYLLVTMGFSEWEGTEDFHGTQMHWSHFSHEKNTEIVANSGFEIVLDEIDASGDERHQVIVAKKL